MVTPRQKKRLRRLSIVAYSICTQESFITTLSNISKRLQRFFKSVKKYVSEPVYGCFWSILILISISHSGTTNWIIKLLPAEIAGWRQAPRQTVGWFHARQDTKNRYRCAYMY